MSTSRPSVPGLRRPPDVLIPPAEPEPAVKAEDKPAPYRGEKLTLYLSTDEVIEIQAFLLELRVNHGVRIDRSRFFRAAMQQLLANKGGAVRAIKRGVGE